MKLTRNRWFGAAKWICTCLIGFVWTATALAQAVTTTTVQGTVYLANGSPAAGAVQLSWPAFTTAANQAVAAGRITVSIGADGFLSVNLAPNLGSTPAGEYYTAVYYLSDGTTNTEYWVVPAAAQATIAQVRSQVMPAAQAVQAVSKAYVDQAVASVNQNAIAPTGGTMTGPLYLSGDPTQSLQAADKHYVDASFAQALPLTGGSATGPLTATQLGAAFQADQFPGADFGAKLQACIAAVSPAYGGICDARNFTGAQSMAANLTISSANTTILLPCATISTSSQIVVTAGTRNVSLRGCALRGASSAGGTQGGTVFSYSGASSMIQIGDPTYAADTPGFHLDNVVINTTAATSSTAQALTAYRTQEMDLESIYLLGNSNQTGMTLDGTANYTGGTFYDNQISGFQVAVNAIGHQITNPATTDWLNASTFVRLHIDCPTNSGNPISGTYGINLQQGDGNTFTGGDVEGCSTALHLGPNAQNNTIVGLRNENSTNQVVADSGSSYNSWMTGGTMFTGKLTDNGTRNSFLDTFHRSFNGINGDWYGSQQDATVTNHYRLGTGAGNERGLLNRYQTDYGYRWTTGLSDATAGEQFYQILDELNNVYRLSIGQYNNGQSSTNNQTVINAAGTGAVVLNGSNNSGTGGVVIGSGGPSEATVATISNAGNAQFNGTLQVGGASTFTSSTTVRNQADAEIDAFLWAGATANQKESYIYKDYTGASQWYMVKDASNNWALNSALGGLDSFKAYQSTNSGDTYINASNPMGVVRVNYESGAGSAFNIYGGSSSNLYASFTAANSIKFPGLAASTGTNCLQIDNSGYISNTGSACGSGGGGVNGTINSGNSGQIAYYTGPGTALSGMSTIPVTAGGTGASTAAAALTALGGASLSATASQTFAGPVMASTNSQCNVMAPPAPAAPAYGDCSHDDSAAIQACVNSVQSSNAMAPGIVYFPKAPGGCYYVANTIQWAGASLQGQPGLGSAAGNGGVILKGAPGKDILHVVDPNSATSNSARSWSIRDLTFELDNSVDASGPTGSFPHRWPGRWVGDGAIASGSTSYSSSHALFTCGDVGQAIQVNGAGPGGANLVTTIAGIPNCYTNPGTVTLAAAASTTVSSALTYISLANMPVTQQIGNCAIAFDNHDGSTADWAVHVGGNLYDTMRDLSFNTTNGLMAGANNTCGIYFQGVWAPYGLDARNINIVRYTYGVVEGVQDTNPPGSAAFSSSVGQDYQRWDHGVFQGAYPWISYDGGENTLTGFEFTSETGPQILAVQAYEGFPAYWMIQNPELEQSVTGETAIAGYRITGNNMTLINTSLAGGSNPTPVANFDASNSVCEECQIDGALEIGGWDDKIYVQNNATQLASLTDNGIGNMVYTTNGGNATVGAQPTRPVAQNLTRGSALAGRISDDFIRAGNVATPYYNSLDLFLWPADIHWTGGTQPNIVADSGSLTGYYTALSSQNHSSLFANAYSKFSGATGTYLISNSPQGGNLPATKVTLYVSLKCPTLTSTNIGAYINGSYVLASVPCTTTYVTQSTTLDLTADAGYAFNLTVGNNSGETDMAWAALVPFTASLNMSGPITFSGNAAASATLSNLVGTPGSGGNTAGQVPTWNGTAYTPKFPVINTGTNILGFGDSVCAYTGSTSNANAWWSLFTAAVGTGAATNLCLSGSLAADVGNQRIFNGGTNIGARYFAPEGAPLSLMEFGVNDARQANALNANVELAYQQYAYANVVTAALPTSNLIVPGNTAITTTGTVANDPFYTAWQGITMSSAGATVSFPITTTGGPIYIANVLYANDTGTETFTIDGTASTDNITGATTYPNAPAAGAPLNEYSVAYTSVVGLARFPVAAATHTVTITCVTPGTNGCTFLYAGTPSPYPAEYTPPTVALFGVIRQQNDADSTATATYDGLNQSVATTLAGDGLNVFFVPVRKFLTASNYSYAMSGSDGATSAGATLSGCSITSGGTYLTCPGHNFSYQDIGKNAYVEGAGASGSSLYAAIASLQGQSAGSNWLTNEVALSVKAATTVTSATAYVGFLGQVYPASTSAGLHPNDYGHWLMARAALETLQPVTSPPVFNNPLTINNSLTLNTPSSGVFNANSNNIHSTATSGASVNPPIEVYDDGSSSYGMILGYNGSNYTLDLFENGGGVRVCPAGSRFNLANLYADCTYTFTATNLTSSKPIVAPSFSGMVVGDGETVYSACNTTGTALSIGTAVDTCQSIGSGFSFTLAAGNSAGQQITLNFCQGATPGTVTPPSNVHGFFIGNGGAVGSTANTCSLQQFRYIPSKSAWYANGPGVVNVP